MFHVSWCQEPLNYDQQKHCWCPWSQRMKHRNVDDAPCVVGRWDQQADGWDGWRPGAQTNSNWITSSYRSSVHCRFTKVQREPTKNWPTTPGPQRLQRLPLLCQPGTATTCMDHSNTVTKYSHSPETTGGQTFLTGTRCRCLHPYDNKGQHLSLRDDQKHQQVLLQPITQ